MTMVLFLLQKWQISIQPIPFYVFIFMLPLRSSPETPKLCLFCKACIYEIVTEKQLND